MDLPTKKTTSVCALYSELCKKNVQTIYFKHLPSLFEAFRQVLAYKDSCKKDHFLKAHR